MASFNPRTFSQPDTLRTISPHRLLSFLSAWRPYLQTRSSSFQGAPRTTLIWIDWRLF